ncbi:MAG: hypothetical protein M3131_05120 [Actinomycetota bacterium]|nr:hypothetical protein [Actinomycetota bacterium]
MLISVLMAFSAGAVASVSPAASAEAAAPPAARIAALPGGALVGMSDNRPETIIDRRFRATGIKRVRVLVPFDDVARGGARRRLQDTWFSTARAYGIEPLVSFYRSSRSKRLLPTPAQYRYHFRLFRQRYPWVRNFSTWNEANFPDAQPTGRDPRRTAEFYRIAKAECRGCNVLTMDFRADGSRHSEWWLRTFKRHIGGGPHRWGLVSHPDVNRFSTARTRWFLKNTRGSVWVTEIGAVNFFGRGFRPNIARQTKVMRFMMTQYPRVSHRIDRMYIYHWRAARNDRLWDSALLSASGQRRPAYFIFFKALGRRAP